MALANRQVIAAAAELRELGDLHWITDPLLSNCFGAESAYLSREAFRAFL
jgi:hypothetical protein